jgi:SAM-dependent methyltransferase
MLVSTEVPGWPLCGVAVALVEISLGQMGTPGTSFDPAAFWEKRLQRFDLAAVGYTGLGLRYNEWLYRVRAFVFRRLLRLSGLDLGSARVLDVGSGTGFYVAEWLRAGAAQVVGSDLTGVSTERLADAFPHAEIVQFDISGEPVFPPSSFDAISAFDVLFHIVDDGRYRTALMNISSLLRDGGYLFMSENFLHGPERRGEHQVSRPLWQIEQFLSEASLEVVTRRPIFVLMNAPLDSKSAFLHRTWHRVQRLVSRDEWTGAAVGALLFPLEVALVSSIREGPSTEAMVCRKRKRG